MGAMLITRDPFDIVVQPNITAGGTPYTHCSAQHDKTYFNRPVEVTRDLTVSAATQMLGALNVAGQLTISDENFNMAFHVYGGRVDATKKFFALNGAQFGGGLTVFVGGCLFENENTFNRRQNFNHLVFLRRPQATLLPV